MDKWSSHTFGYKAGVVILLVGTVMYLVGFASPYWIYYRETGEDAGWRVYSGLWRSCYVSKISDTCSSPGFLKVIPFVVIKFLLTMGLMMLGGSCGLALVHSCTKYDKKRRQPGVYSGAAGLSGFIGCMVFVGEYEKVATEADSEVPYGWAFALTLAACLLSMLNAILLALCNNPATTDTTPAAATFTPAAHTTVGGGSGVILAGPPPAGYPAAAQYSAEYVKSSASP